MQHVANRIFRLALAYFLVLLSQQKEGIFPPKNKIDTVHKFQVGIFFLLTSTFRSKTELGGGHGTKPNLTLLDQT